MDNKCNFLCFFLLYIFMASGQHPMYIPNFCYNYKNKDSRLNTTIFSTKHVSRQVDCLTECDREPCCRSINFKREWSSDIEKNCEMLHNVVYNTSEKLLEPNPSFDHLYFPESQKEYSASCLTFQDSGKCSQSEHSCHTNAKCSDTVVGSSHCECRRGYHGDGFNCTDIDECSTGESNDCDANANCTNTIGSYTCGCRDGFIGNGKSCSDMDECSEGNHDCGLNATCINTIGSYRCDCHDGLAGNGRNCSDFNESTIMSSEPDEYKNKLGEWLPGGKKWKICWRASDYSWSAQEFHAKCQMKKTTLVIIKVANNDTYFIFGGYSTETWTGEGGKPAPGSFIFSLRNNDNLQPFKAPLRNENDPKAIINHNDHGPIFGAGWDFGIRLSAGTVSAANFGLSYQSPPGYIYNKENTKSLLAGSLNFTPSEVEVLYLN